MDRYAKTLEQLAVVLDYPTPAVPQQVDECLLQLWALADKDAALGKAVDCMRAFVACPALAEGHSRLEELYLQTFEMNPTRTLDLGWQLFGEDYNRGLFLVKLRQEMRRLDIPETSELPDHATQVLRLIARMEPEKAEKFVLPCVLPALKKSWAAIDAECAYRFPVEAALRLLATRYGVALEDISSEGDSIADLRRDCSQDCNGSTSTEEVAGHGAIV
jgi:nitrate reductase delta subunit